MVALILVSFLPKIGVSSNNSRENSCGNVDFVSFRKQEKSGSDRSGEYLGVRQFRNLVLRQKLLYKHSVMPPCIIGRGGSPTTMLLFDPFMPIIKLSKPRVQSLQNHGVISIHPLQPCMTLEC
ncbi:hypothetical protein AVEN_146180-1 [Araneus ventricosus]|uniref:Uncharacterized protein n=1 Tax=Araneus ventricosus TaxID=182803 RepID=A0A4Y2CIW8_ARAVE|nr:hypothetical protein AVEN_146180-1 [Araneus ventricosus]